MAEFGLSENKWFVKMFGLRIFWIPAYFRDVPVSGLFKTTSMSESENSFFRRYLNRGANLVEFFMHNGSAIDAQRNARDQLSHLDESCFPDTKTTWQLEKHAASVYPSQIFYDAQRQIMLVVAQCRMMGMSSNSKQTVYDVDDELNGTFRIVHSFNDDYVACDCKRFIRRGWLCRHLFFVFHNMKMKNIPDKYVLDRWKKFACPKFDGNFVGQDADSAISNEVVSDFYNCFGVVKGTRHMSELRRDIGALKDKYFTRLNTFKVGDGKNDAIQELYGASVLENVEVLPPDVVMTKGSGRRLKSKKELEIQRTLRPPRICSICKKLCHHDARNCPENLPTSNNA